ncbi:MAG: GTP-binding protein, partial [Ruminococcus sp.]|nr:GTP-binding protein [Ruminococcus sp.]
MNQIQANKIKNIALAGHHSSGKTALAEALLYRAGASDRHGKIAEGTTVCDFDPEEIKRKASLSTALAGFQYEDYWMNLLDTPGILDFAGEELSGIAAADTVLITVSAKSGVRVGTKKAYAAAKAMNKSTMFAVTKTDDKDANFYNVLTELKTVFGPTVCPVVVPVIKDAQIVSYVNLIEMKAYTYDNNGKAVEAEVPDIDMAEKEYRLEGLVAAVSEAVAETDEALMEKFFEGEAFTQKELIDGIHNGMNQGLITPVVCTSALTMAGIDMLLKEFELLVPAADEVPSDIKCDASAPLAALVCKTVADPFVGKMSYLKVLSGKISSDMTVINSRTGAEEKIGKLYTLLGKKQTEVKSAEAGDIVAAVKISASTGDTLCTPGNGVEAEMPEFPHPCYSMAVRAKNQGDESKISGGMQRLVEE